MAGRVPVRRGLAIRRRPDAYEKFYTGQLDAKTDPQLRQTLEKYKELIPYL